MTYHELFTITIDHQYYPAGTPVELLIVPDQETIRQLKGQQLLVKTILNGIRVLAETDDHKPMVSLTNKLTFEVYPTSAAFHTYTDTSELVVGEYWAFSNTSLLPDFQLTASIGAGESKGLNGFQQVAAIDIYPTNELLDYTKATPYMISFNALSAVWKYYLVTNWEEANLVIQDKGNPALLFNKVELPDTTTDPVATALRENFTNADILLFESATPVPCQNSGRKNIQLVYDDQVIIRNLPNPTPENKETRIIKIFK